MLYACMTDDEDVFVPSEIRERVRSEYNNLGLDVSQPVRKVSLCIYRVEDQLRIEPIVVEESATGDDAAGTMAFDDGNANARSQNK